MAKYIWKRATSEVFKERNPILDNGIIGYETDTRYFKYGDGVTKYNDLPYVNKPKSAYDIAVENGFNGSQEEWLESLHGESAYQQAVALGYEGTVQDYYKATITGISDYSWGNF